MPKNSISISPFKILLAAGSCVFLSSCMTCGFSRSAEDDIRLSVPYAEGDETGDLTNSIIGALSTNTNCHIAKDCRYAIKIKILDDSKETLGYRYKDPHKKQNLVTCESRILMLAQVDIIDTYTKKTIRGPGFIRGFVEYDHQHKAKNNKLNQESLGQLEDTSADRAMVPTGLYRDLANKIALWVQQQIDLMPFETR